MLSRSTRSRRSTAAVAVLADGGAHGLGAVVATGGQRHRGGDGGRPEHARGRDGASHGASWLSKEPPRPPGASFRHASCAFWNFGSSGSNPRPFDPDLRAAVLVERRVGHVDAVLAHAARLRERRLLELLLLLRRHLRRLHRLEVLAARLVGGVDLRRRGALGHHQADAPLVRIGVGHVDAVLAHALRERERGVASLLLPAVRTAAGVVLATSGDRKGGHGQQRGGERSEWDVGSHGSNGAAAP